MSAKIDVDMYGVPTWLIPTVLTVLVFGGAGFLVYATIDIDSSAQRRRACAEVECKRVVEELDGKFVSFTSSEMGYQCSYEKGGFAQIVPVKCEDRP